MAFYLSAFFFFTMSDLPTDLPLKKTSIPENRLTRSEKTADKSVRTAPTFQLILIKCVLAQRNTANQTRFCAFSFERSRETLASTCTKVCGCDAFII